MSEKIEEAGKSYQDSSKVASQTLSAPLLSGSFHAGGAVPWNLSPFESLFQVGYKGDLLYQHITGKSFRIQYRNLEEEASFYYLFEEPMDLRNRWFVLHYRGAEVPSHIKIQIDYRESRVNGDFDLYLESFLEPQNAFFKLPGRLPFGEVSSIRFTIDPDWLVSRDADFVILGFEMLPEDTDPLRDHLSVFESNRLDWYLEPLEPENRASVNTAQTF